MTDLRRGRERFYNKWFKPVAMRPMLTKLDIRILGRKIKRAHEILRHHFGCKKDNVQNPPST